MCTLFQKLRIFKYILLLLLLFFFAFTVFVYTEDGRYTFEERMSIDLDTAILLPYVKENKNWQFPPPPPPIPHPTQSAPIFAHFQL